MVESLTAGLAALDPDSQQEGMELVPRSVTINYPEKEENWPAVLVQFRITSPVQWAGLFPDQYTAISPVPSSVSDPFYTGQRNVYFEGAWDLTVLALASEERDRLWDTIFDLILMNPLSPASAAFYNTLTYGDLIAMTVNPAMVQPMGDVINQGVPWDPDEFTYEATVRILCVGTYQEGATIVNGVEEGGPFIEKFFQLSAVGVEPYIEPPGEPYDPDGGWVTPT